MQTKRLSHESDSMYMFRCLAMSSCAGMIAEFCTVWSDVARVRLMIQKTKPGQSP